MGNCMNCFQTSSESAGAPNTTTAPICQKPHVEETDELLSPRSPLKNANNCDTKRNSFKKSLVLLNGNAATMSDIITTAVKESLEVSDNTLNQLFEEYKDPEEDMILTEGIERLCHDLKYQPDEFAILVLAWCLDASQMCRFTKAEFIEGLHKMCADTIEKIRIRLEQTIEMLKVDTEMFKQLYRFTFRFGLEPEQRILSLDMAISLWKLVFTVHTPELLSNWIHFLEQHPSIRGIPKDTWNMFLNFSEQCDINNYDDTEAWPSLFDDFVDYERSRMTTLTEGTESEAMAESSNGATAMVGESVGGSQLEASLAADGYVDDDNNNDDFSRQPHQHAMHAHQSQLGKTDTKAKAGVRNANDDIL
ncbi:PREDICTED: DCN1-like protein 3 [Rhagoletis zephyria]|uniref:DCN1-like protein 3 n=1 Tax=Rhagoletis zephyria TaxID=28612 RepID=UPI0008112813|nr:PREDICTED: DCN1-like protein 3 [Rhagoletis zephyria]XP_017476065.1 PREDICTED: DCN1-like protein 3 [Rhagoletis zephyria]XP_017476072.1 PREDICTED: DCN1-like protein 3 [Rhagoletis zephyria]